MIFYVIQGQDLKVIKCTERANLSIRFCSAISVSIASYLVLFGLVRCITSMSTFETK